MPGLLPRLHQVCGKMLFFLTGSVVIENVILFNFNLILILILENAILFNFNLILILKLKLKKNNIFYKNTTC